MQIIAGIAGLVAVLTSWIVSLRLLWLARSTRQTPELLIGLGLLFAGGLWNPLMAVGRQAEALPDETRVALVTCAAATGVVGTFCLGLFTWRVFRRDAAWAAMAAAAVGLAMVGVMALQAREPGWIAYAREERGPWQLATWIGAVNYLWATLEVWREHGLLARRHRLGLVDPVVLDRMRLWGLMMVFSLVASATFGTFQVLGVPIGGTALGLSLSAVAAGLSSVCLWLVFLPPAAYLARVRARAEGTPAAAV